MTASTHIENIRAALAAGPTPGEWRKVSHGGMSTVLCGQHPPRNDMRTNCTYAFRGDEFCVGAPFLEENGTPRLDYVEFGHGDAALIAACNPVAIAALLAELDRLEAALAAMPKQEPAAVEHLSKLLDEARAVYQAAERAGVDVQIGYYRRLSAGKELLSALYLAPPAPVSVKALEWRQGYRDAGVNIQQVSPVPLYQIRELDGLVWLDVYSQQTIYPSVEAAKAAAQADYEARVRSTIVSTANTSPEPVIHEGWQLVPRVPTNEMIKAALDACPVAPPDIADSRLADYFVMAAEYRAMLAAAPKEASHDGD